MWNPIDAIVITYYSLQLIKISIGIKITEAIIAMAHKLDIKVVAEGVETLAQQERLRTQQQQQT